jgi:peptide chain release factor
VVAQLALAFCREGSALGLDCEVLEPVSGPAPSLLLAVRGVASEAFAQARTGTIRWIGTSPFRPTHKRRNWFVGVDRLPDAEDGPDLRERDIRYQAMRASGPGGQHVNKTDSAVRATHLPTGLTATAQDQRSQFANRKLARMKLAMLIDERRQQAKAGDRRDRWDRNHDLERGNAVRSYEGAQFRLRD